MRTTTGPLARRVLALGLTAYLSLSCSAGSRQFAESASHTGSKREPRAFGLTLVIPNMRRDWSGIVSLFPDTEEHQPIRRIPLDVLLPGLVGAGLAPHLLLDRPVYAFMFSEENPPPGAGSALLSVGLDDCSATLADLPEDQYRTFSTKNGVTTFDPLPETAALFEKDSRCEVWSLPKGKCRLLCGQRVDLESQPTERLVATVPPAGYDGDWFYASFNLPQLKKEAFATLPEPRNAAQRLGQGLSIDAMNDLGNVGMGLSAGPKDVRLRLDLEFASSHALISDTVLGRAVEERVEEAFFDLPEESLFALRLSGMERGKRRDDVRTLLSRLLDLSGEQASPEEREEMLTAAGKLIFAGGPSIWAWGFDFQRARSELLNFFRRQGDESSRTQQLARAWRPWVVFGFVESDGAAWLAELDRAISASGVTPVSDKTAAQAKPDAQDDTTESTSFRRPAPSGAPKGTRYFVSRRNSDNPMHILLMPKKEMVWGCAASALEICLRQLSTIHSKTARTLRDTPWAEALKTARGSLIGVTSPLGLAALTVETESEKTVLEAGEALDIVGQLPDDGDFPLIMIGKTVLGDAERGTVSVSTQLPRTAIPYELFAD